MRASPKRDSRKCSMPWLSGKKRSRKTAVTLSFFRDSRPSERRPTRSTANCPVTGAVKRVLERPGNGGITFDKENFVFHPILPDWNPHRRLRFALGRPTREFPIAGPRISLLGLEYKAIMLAAN